MRAAVQGFPRLRHVRRSSSVNVGRTVDHGSPVRLAARGEAPAHHPFDLVGWFLAQRHVIVDTGAVEAAADLLRLLVLVAADLADVAVALLPLGRCWLRDLLDRLADLLLLRLQCDIGLREHPD